MAIPTAVLFSLPLRYDLVTLCLYGDLDQINVIAVILKPRKRFRMSQILFEQGINSLPLVCFREYWNLSTLSIEYHAWPSAARGIAMLRVEGVTNNTIIKNFLHQSMSSDLDFSFTVHCDTHYELVL